MQFFENAHGLCNSKDDEVAHQTKKKWLETGIDILINRANYIMDIMENTYRKRSSNGGVENKLIDDFLKCILDMEKPLVIMWNVMKASNKEIERWTYLLNDVLEKYSMARDTKHKGRRICQFSWNEIRKFACLEMLSDYHRYVHGKVVKAKSHYDETIGRLLIVHIDTAFYNLLRANRIYPTTHEEYEKRRKLISSVITEIDSMERSIISYFNLMCYSEKVLEEWSLKHAAVKNSLHSVQRSDRTRFGKLT